MRFTDKMCYEVSKDIIEDIFLIKYTPTIIKEKTWYDNLNSFFGERMDTHSNCRRRYRAIYRK